MIEKPTVLNLLKTIKSGVGLDVSKNHTGICIWNGDTIETYGFSIDTYDKSDPFAEYRMRRKFKAKLSEIVKDRVFEYCVIEDVYGGENFDTVRKLLSLNTVIDELIFDGVCTVDTFYRWNEPKWLGLTRMFYKQKGKLKSKIETQGILEYLEYAFYLRNKDLSDSEKKAIFFEDICDATAMLLGVVAHKFIDINTEKYSGIKLSDIKLVYLEDLLDTYSCRDKRIKEEGFIMVDLDFRHLEKSIVSNVVSHPNDVLCAYLPSSKLGVFGLKQGFTFYDSDESYLLFYKK